MQSNAGTVKPVASPSRSEPLRLRETELRRSLQVNRKQEGGEQLMGNPVNIPFKAKPSIGPANPLQHNPIRVTPKPGPVIPKPGK
jgi:hypothetical protein